MDLFQLSITKVIIVLNVVISAIAFFNKKLMNSWIFNPYEIKQKNQYYRFFTAAFLHGNLMHLGLNMLVLWQFGQALETKFYESYDYNQGKVIMYYLLLYIPAIVVSCLYSFFKHRNNPNYNALGASGAIAAVVFAYIGIRPLERLYLFGVLKLPAFGFAALFLMVSWVLGRSSKDNIGHDAHLFGALFGLAYIFAIQPYRFHDFILDIQVYFQNMF